MARSSSKGSSSGKSSTASLGFEAKLWLAADKLRNNMDAAEYSRAKRDRSPEATRRVGAKRPINHVVLGLIFLKYISDAFEQHRSKLVAGEGEYAGANPEDQDEPSGARQTAEGSPQGERGAVHQFYTPSCVVRCLVEMLAPYKGRIYDPACGSGGSLPARRLRRNRSAHSGRAVSHCGVQSEKFVEFHGGKLGDISIYGQKRGAWRQRPSGRCASPKGELQRQQPKSTHATAA